jgi:hypothetical protein
MNPLSAVVATRQHGRIRNWNQELSGARELAGERSGQRKKWPEKEVARERSGQRKKWPEKEVARERNEWVVILGLLGSQKGLLEMG